MWRSAFRGTPPSPLPHPLERRLAPLARSVVRRAARLASSATTAPSERRYLSAKAIDSRTGRQRTGCRAAPSHGAPSRAPRAPERAPPERFESKRPTPCATTDCHESMRLPEY